jgi:hypothetical protein
MRGRHLRLAVVLLAIAPMFACGTITATLLTTGNDVRVDGASAISGQPLLPGASVTTGTRSSALVEFSDGTSVQIIEAVDPVRFAWTKDRLVLRIDDATVEANKGEKFSLINVISELAEFFSFSHVISEEKRARFFRADLVSGRMQMTRPQTGANQTDGEFFQVTAAGRVEFGRTSPEHLRALRKRFDRWDFRRAREAAAVEVPILQFLLLRDAVARLEAVGLGLGTVSGPSVGDGIVVVKQTPQPRFRVPLGSRVNVETELRPVVATVEVPDVRRLELKEAYAKLEAAGLKSGGLSGATAGDAVMVTDQSPAPGSRVPEGSLVDLTVVGVIR